LRASLVPGRPGDSRAQIRERFGPDHSMLFDDVKHKLRCGKCGGKQFGVTRTPANDEQGTGLALI